MGPFQQAFLALDAKLTANGRPAKEQQVPRLFCENFVRRMHTGLAKGQLSVRRAASLLEMTIEDLAQLIYDLKQINPDARVCVKLVAATGIGTIAAVFLLFHLVRILTAPAGPEAAVAAQPVAEGTVENIGRALFTTYLLPFELISFLILAAIVGAVTLSKQQSDS